MSPAKAFVLCVHGHQPVGNFGWVFEEAYEKSYKPFFEVLEKHPSLPAVCHLSGGLIDWLERHKPDFLNRLRKMADGGQLEFLGGGYYEPIYGVIPKRDLEGQIAMMRKKIKLLFGQEPKGVWLTERVWDPDLVRPLAAAKAEYTILDDLHFEKAGVKTPLVTGYYTAKAGKASVDLFASMKQLRYLMPFRRPEETIEFFKSSPSGPEDIFVFADDVEKFGLWPGTYHWVYEEGWLDRFFTLLEKEAGLRVCTFSQFRKKAKSKGTLRVPHGSYTEMMEWSGGRFYNFFDKYPESRYMRDRMWQVSELLNEALAKNGSAEAHRQAKEALYKAQCNCSYWHGVFGGLYLHHLRSAVFENLIKADDLVAGAKNAAGAIERLPGSAHWTVRQKKLVSFFNPGYGAALEELDFLPKFANLTCNLQRHPEAYHAVALKKTAESPAAGEPLSIHAMLGTKEKDLEKHLHYDKFRRLSFLDHFFEATVSLEEFAKSLYKEAGDFADAAYSRGRVAARQGKKSLVFEKKGSLRLGIRKSTLTLQKTVQPAGEAALEVRYVLKNPGASAVEAVFGVELNFSIGDDHARQGLSERGVKEWVFNDAWRGIKIRVAVSEPCDLLTAPIETISESESGLERTYQELAALFQRPFRLGPKEEKNFAFRLEVA